MKKVFRQGFSEMSLKRISDIISPPKIDKNLLQIKKTIDLFYQINQMEDFDPAEQFDLIQNVPISQQVFCKLLTEVLFRKTKNLISVKEKFINFFLSSKNDPNKSNQLISLSNQEQSQQNFHNQDKTQFIQQNQQKLFCQILQNIRYACLRLEQLIYNMIDIHQWQCQSKRNCNETYMEGHVAKILFKKLILSSPTLKIEFQSLKELIQLNPITRGNKTDIESLKYEISKWGSELLKEITKQKIQSINLDQKPSQQIKYFICERCYYADNQVDLEQKIKKGKNKKKNKNKKKKNDHDGSQSQSSNEVSRKGSFFSIQDRSTSEQVNEETKYMEDKNIQRLSNFLQDFKIDFENRIQIRLQIQTDEQEAQNEPKSHLSQRIKNILYKNKHDSEEIKLSTKS